MKENKTRNRVEENTSQENQIAEAKDEFDKESKTNSKEGSANNKGAEPQNDSTSTPGNQKISVNIKELETKQKANEIIKIIICAVLWTVGVLFFIGLFIFLKCLGVSSIHIFLIFLYIFALLLVILITASFMIFMTSKRETERINEKHLLNYDIPENYKENILRLIEKKYDYIFNYLLFQVTHKVLGILSIVYSVLGLFTLFNSNELDITFIECLIPFSAIVCVLVTLYVAQPSRVTQYLEAWRRCNKLILIVTSEMYNATEYYKILKNFNSTVSIDTESDMLAKNKTSTTKNISLNTSYEIDSELIDVVYNCSDEEKEKKALDFFRKQNSTLLSELSDIEFSLSSDSE